LAAHDEENLFFCEDHLCSNFFPITNRFARKIKFASPANICGGKGIRTPGLLIANETLYQLSYTPLKIFPVKFYDQLRTKTIELEPDSASEKTRSPVNAPRFTPSYRSSDRAYP